LLPCLALAQALGIVLADLGAVPPIAAAAAGLALLLFGAMPGRHSLLRALAATGIAVCAGALHLGVQLESAECGQPNDAEVRTIEATVAWVVRGAGWTQVRLDALRAVDGGAPLPRSVRVSIEADAQDGPRFEDAPSGARVRARLRLREPGGLQNPGARDRRRALDRSGIGALARLEKPALSTRLSGRDAPGTFGSIHRLRSTIRTRLGQVGPGGALIRALALGDRSGLPRSLSETLAGLGLSHLLAVSGLHLALVSGLVFTAVRAVLVFVPGFAARRDVRRSALAAAVVAATLYAGLAGWGVPVRRALVLLLALALAVAAGRDRGRAAPLAAAALGILAFEPEALFLPGPQLSFAASAALLASLRGTPHVQGRNALATWLIGMVRASATAIAATAPLAAWHMGRVAPLGVIANLVGIPWTACVLLPLSLVASFAAAIPALPGSDVMIEVAARVGAATLHSVEWVAARVPVVPPRPPPAVGAWMGCGLVSLATLLARSTRARVAGALAIGALLTFAPAAEIDPPRPRLAFLDVGQGDAVLVQSRSSSGEGPGGSVVVDAGTAIPGGLDLGRYAVVPALRALGVERLDLVVASHGDLDHRGGLPAVVEAFPVGEVWLPFGARADPSFEALLATARVRGVRVVERGANSESIRLDGMIVTPLWPARDAGGGSRNDRSLVLRVEVAGHRVLLTGDLEASGEASLLASGVDLRADILKLSHHGSRSSSTEAFLGAVDPLLAVASAPYRGRFAMPHPEVLERTRRRGIPVWWTGRDGAVLVGLEGDPVVFGFGSSE
jgi:competence protein ComEC